MKYFHFATLAMLLALYPSIVKAGAMAVLDQRDTAGMAGGSGEGLSAQTFTVGITGELSSVELLVYSNHQPVDAEIATTAAGVPTTTILAQDTVTPLVTTGTWVTFNYPSPISVQAGEVLAIEVNNSAFTWGEDATASYPGGGPYWYAFNTWRVAPGGGDFDYQFQTFVIPAPEPSSLLLLTIGAAGLFMAARRRNA